MAAAVTQGPCPRCIGRGVAAGGVRCFQCAGTGEAPLCRDHARAAWFPWRQSNRRRGLCPCGAPPTPGYRTCWPCRHWEAVRKRIKREPHRAKRRAWLALPADLKRYGWAMADVALEWHEAEERRRREWWEAAEAQRRRTALSRLPERRQTFVVAYVENGGNATRAALTAGFCAASAAAGGRAASVRGCILLRDPRIIRAIGEVEAVREREARERNGAAMGERIEIEAVLSELAAGPVSKVQRKAARLLQRMQ